MHTLPSEITGILDRHLDAVRRLERGDLRGADRGRPPGRGRADGRYLDATARGAAEARRAVVLRRILRDLAPARVSAASCSGSVAAAGFAANCRGHPAERRRDRRAGGDPAAWHADLFLRRADAITPQELIAGAALLRKIRPGAGDPYRRAAAFARPPTWPTCSPVCAARPMCAGSW